MTRVSRLFFDVAAQTHNEAINGARICVFMQSPDFFQNLFARDRTSVVADQVTQQLRLHERELKHRFTASQLQTLEIHGLAIELKNIAGARRRRGLCPGFAPEQAADSGNQDVKIEGLLQIIVSARFEALQHVFRAPTRREHQDGNIVFRGAQCASHGEAVFSGKHYVEHHSVKLFVFLEQVFERGFAIFHQLDGIAFGFQIEAQASRDVGFILDDQQTAHTRYTRGSRMVNVLPRPSPSLSALTSPPWRLIISRTMNSPRPVPLTRSVARLYTR